VKAEVVGKSIYLQQNYHFGPLNWRDNEVMHGTEEGMLGS
jgi:hypothetical protein